jgi:hypothetical protein
MRNDPLKSWHPGAVKSRIVDFLARVRRAQGSDYVAEGERVTVFDNDGAKESGGRSSGKQPSA